MRIGPFNFGKKDDDASVEIVPSECAEIVYSSDADDVDLSLYRVVEIDPESVGGRDFFDALIPLAGNVADAAAQYDHAIVKFPEGIGWNDLLNRKTPGWEQFKQCGGFGKNGKFNPQAAIRQVKVSPAAVANIALQAAAVAVGQAYMTEISERLNSIEEGVSKIQREMKRERDSKIEASFLMLKDYIEHYAEYSELPEKNQAVQNALEGIKRDALAAWSFQIQSLNDLGLQVRKGRKVRWCRSEELPECTRKLRQLRRRRLHRPSHGEPDGTSVQRHVRPRQAQGLRAPGDRILRGVRQGALWSSGGPPKEDRHLEGKAVRRPQTGG